MYVVIKQKNVHVRSYKTKEFHNYVHVRSYKTKEFHNFSYLLRMYVVIKQKNFITFLIFYVEKCQKRDQSMSNDVLKL